MKDKRFRKCLYNYTEDEGILLFENPSFDNSIIGITDDNRVIYDYELMIDEYMKDEDCNYLDAIEFIDFNTLRASSYIQNSPIVLLTRKEDIYDYE